jgi:hypothetical protein
MKRMEEMSFKVLDAAPGISIHFIYLIPASLHYFGFKFANKDVSLYTSIDE